MLDALFGGIGRGIAIGNWHQPRIGTVIVYACLEALAVPLPLVIDTENVLTRSSWMHVLEALAVPLPLVIGTTNTLTRSFCMHLLEALAVSLSLVIGTTTR